MSARELRLGVLTSTGGAVLGGLMAQSAWFRRQLVVVAADRNCGALERARAAGVAAELCMHEEADSREALLNAAFEQHGVEHVLVFYTRLLRHSLLERFRGRLWNLHPALLPAFPGRHGFEDGFASGARVLGTTLHAIDAGCDSGPMLIQTAFARAPGMDERAARHAVFGQQVRSALQACRWLAAGRVHCSSGRVDLNAAPAATLLAGALYSPGLDDTEAATLEIPAPVAMKPATKAATKAAMKAAS